MSLLVVLRPASAPLCRIARHRTILPKTARPRACSTWPGPALELPVAGLGRAGGGRTADGAGEVVDAADPLVERVGDVEVAGVVEFQRPGNSKPGLGGRPAIAAVVVAR